MPGPGDYARAFISPFFAPFRVASDAAIGLWNGISKVTGAVFSGLGKVGSGLFNAATSPLKLFNASDQTRGTIGRVLLGALAVGATVLFGAAALGAAVAIGGAALAVAGTVGGAIVGGVGAAALAVAHAAPVLLPLLGVATVKGGLNMINVARGNGAEYHPLTGRTKENKALTSGIATIQPIQPIYNKPTLRNSSPIVWYEIPSQPQPQQRQQQQQSQQQSSQQRQTSSYTKLR